MTELNRDDLEHRHPYWHTWRGVGGLLYARRLLSSPPIVVRAEDQTDLEEQIVDVETNGRRRLPSFTEKGDEQPPGHK